MSLQNCCRKLSFVLAVLALVVLAAPAFATTCPAGASCNCIQNEWNLEQGFGQFNTSSSATLNCTANDVRVAKVLNVRDPSTGGQLASCNEGQLFNFIADFEIQTTSQASRSNIGMYIAETGTTTAAALSVTNTCADNLIPPPPNFVNKNTTGKTPTVGANGLFPCFSGSSINCGTNYYDEYDPPPDNCGDTSSTDAGISGLSGSQLVTLYIQGFQCPTSTTGLPTCTVGGVTGPCAVLPNCTSWQVPGKTISCVAPTGTQSYNLSATPGDKSKCNCETIVFPVLVQTPVVSVTKACTTNDSSGLNTSCSSGTEGVDEVTYTVTVTNGSNFGTISLTSLTDSVYGDLIPGTGTHSWDSDGCSAQSAISVGSSNAYTCTFTAHKYGDPGTGTGQATVTDTISASGGTSNDGPWGQTSNSVTVTPTEPSSSATVTKGLGSPNLTAGCATANFTVDVKNTSSNAGCPPGGCDETETLTALSDSAYGSIAPTSTSAVSNNTCFTSTSGVSIAPNTDYTCGFSAEFCGTLQPVEEYGTGKCGSNGLCSAGQPSSTVCTTDAQCDLTCLGLTHTNSITATINGDEGAGDLVATTHNTLTTNVCLNPFTQSQ